MNFLTHAISHIDPESLLISLSILIVSIALHEFAHCWMIDRLGDDTPRVQGRLTLNPLVHLDPLGTIVMVVSALAGFWIGWGKPSPFNPNNFEHPARDRMLTALAGPISNLLQMLAWASLALLVLPFFHQPYVDFIGGICQYGVIINAVLAIFNLIPVYPLDGHHILSFLAPPSLRPIIDNPIWMIVFLLLVFSGAFGHIVSPVLGIAEHVTQFLVGWPV